MPFIIDGVEQNIRGTLTSVCVDNPASNMLGRFKNLSSAFCKCRHCLATEEDIQKWYVCSVYVLEKYIDSSNTNLSYHQFCNTV